MEDFFIYIYKSNVRTFSKLKTVNIHKNKFIDHF